VLQDSVLPEWPFIVVQIVMAELSFEAPAPGLCGPGFVWHNLTRGKIV